jgi:subfamily B ATP-binding cassette protein MsbA
MGIFSDILYHLRLYRKYIGRRLYIVFVLSILTALTEGFGITLLLPLIQFAGAEGGSSANLQDAGTAERLLFDLLSWIGIANSLIGILLFIAVVFICKGALHFIKGAYSGYLRTELLRELKVSMFDSYSDMNYQYYTSNNTGHFINVINTQIDRFLNSFSHFNGFLSSLITAGSYFAIAVALTWKFALAALVVGGILLGLFQYLNRYVRNLSRKQSSEQSHLQKLLVQNLQAFKYIVSTHQKGHLRKNVLDSVERLTTYQFKQKVAAAFTGAIREPVSVLFLVTIIAFQALYLGDPIAPIFVALLLFHRGMQTVIGIQGGWQRVMDVGGSVEMVDDEFNVIRDEMESSGSEEVGTLSNRILFDGVSFSYDDEQYALADVDLRIPANTTVALVGESGAGKSTLIDMLTLLLQPQRGAVYVDGTRHDEIDLASWRSQIGYVSQETVVFDDTIANNISLWRGDVTTDDALRERVKDAARRAYAHHFIDDLPDGYQTVVGEQGVRLSGGQRQRLFIARELFKRPNLLILDEATSALDTESERYIQESIDALKGEMTVVIIAHRLSTIKNVDQVYVLDDGRVIESGSYEELRNHDESRFRQMVEMQTL